FLERIRELLQRRGESGRRAAEQIVDALRLGRERLEASQAAAGATHLLRKQIVVHPAHAADFDAATQPAVSIRMRRTRGELRALPAITLGPDVRDVVARYIERSLKRQ